MGKFAKALPEKFAALAQLSQETSQLTEAYSEEKASKGPGRPKGKSSNSNYESTTLLLTKSTKKAARRKLEDTESDMDMSELVSDLLDDWLKK
jgi:hypothetical protein